MLGKMRILLASAVAIFIVLSFAANSFASILETLKFNSKFLKREYIANIYLPYHYKSSGLKYPVLYLLHESNGDENSWLKNGNIRQTADKLLAERKIPPSIIAMPSHSNAWWIDGNREPAETIFFKELIPAVEKKYRTIKDRSGRAIAGVGAGGYGTIRYIFKHPDMFAAGAVLSPAIYSPLPPKDSSACRSHAFIDANGNFEEGTWKRLNYPLFINEYFRAGIKVPLYINSGDHDKFDIAYHAAVLFNRLREHQPNLIEFRVIDGDHDWKVWSETIDKAMIYILNFVNKPVR